MLIIPTGSPVFNILTVRRAFLLLLPSKILTNFNLFKPAAQIAKENT